MSTQEELFQRHREAEARVQEHQTLIDFHQKEMANIEETLGQLTSAGNTHTAADGPRDGSVSIIESIRESGNHLGAMQVIARQNGNQLDLEHAARMIRMAGMSQSSTVRLVSSLRCRANESPQWETTDRDTVRFMPTVEPPAENPEAGDDLTDVDQPGEPPGNEYEPEDFGEDSQEDSGEPAPVTMTNGAWIG